MDRVYACYDENIGLTSKDYAQNWYLNVKKDESLIGTKITRMQFAELQDTWKTYLPSWNELMTRDENQYELDDIDEDSIYFQAGQDEVNDQKVDSADGKTVAEIKDDEHNNFVDDAIVSGATAGATVVHEVMYSSAVGAQAAEQTAKTNFIEAFDNPTITDQNLDVEMENVTNAKDNTSQATKKENISLIAACALNLAVGVLYAATKPNLDATRALNVLNTLFNGDIKSSLEGAQETLREIGGEITDRREESEIAFDELGETDEESKTEEETIKEELEAKRELYEKTKQAYQEIVEKHNSGEELSPDDIEKLNLVKLQIASLGEEVAELEERYNEILETNLGDLEAKAEEHAEKQDAVAEAQEAAEEQTAYMEYAKGQTDAAAEFDEATRTSEIIQIVSQGLNVASSALNATRAFTRAAALNIFGGWVYTAAGIAAVAGGAMSAIGVAEQVTYLGDTNDEIDSRKNTETLNGQTAEVYEATLAVSNDAVDSMDEINSGYENFELGDELDFTGFDELPDVDLSGGNSTSGTGQDTGSTGQTDDTDSNDAKLRE